MKPLLISGIGRSGTSAVISSLATHHEVLTPNRIGEAPLINEFISFLMEYEDESPNREYHLKNYQLDRPERAKAFSDMLIKCQYGIENIPEDASSKFWIAKVSLNQVQHKKAEEIFGDVSTVYVMRNGVEVVNSALSFHGFADLTFEQLCRRWVDNIAASQYLFSAKNCSVVRHDQLIADPVSVYKRVFSEVGLSDDDAPADFIGSTLFNSSFDDKGRMSSASQVFKDRQAGWFRWSEQQQEVFKEICDGTMQEYGFRRIYDEATCADAVNSGPLSQQARKMPVQEVSPKPARVEVQTSAESESTNKVAGSDIKYDVSERLRKLCDGVMPVGVLDYLVSISGRLGYLYFENPKVASSSILSALQKAERAGLEQTPVCKKQGVHNKKLSPLSGLSDLPHDEQDAWLFSPKHPRFTVVRNPYMRLVSAYLSKIDRSLPAKADVLAVLQSKKRHEISDLTPEVSFRQFVEVVCSQKMMQMNTHWRPQSAQLLIGHVEYDYIGRFEQLEKSYSIINDKYLSSSLKLDKPKNKTNSLFRASELYEEDLVALVNKTFYDDFEAFGYERGLAQALEAAA